MDYGYHRLIIFSIGNNNNSFCFKICKDFIYFKGNFFVALYASIEKPSNNCNFSLTTLSYQFLVSLDCAKDCIGI